MKALPESPSAPEGPKTGTHVLDQVENPFARIYCRSRRLRPTLCDGTCHGCKKERNAYFENKIQFRRTLEQANPAHGEGLDHEREPSDDATITKIILREIEAIEAQKFQIWRKAILEGQSVGEAVSSLILPPPDDPQAPDGTDSESQSSPK